MLELRIPPPYANTEIERVKQIIEYVEETQLQLGSRAANQRLIDEIGVNVSRVRNEAYCTEALDYHLGLLCAYVGNAKAAAHHIDRSNALPGSGGRKIFSDHLAESLELHRRQELAKSRSIPSVLIAAMPRSASASLTQTIGTLLDIPTMRASCGNFPEYFLMPRWFGLAASGAAVFHDHFGASLFNLRVLTDNNVNEVFVRIRDPRSAIYSWLSLRIKVGTLNIATDFEHTLIQEYNRCFIPWLQGWIAVATKPEFGIKVHWSLYQPRRDAVADAVRGILSTLAATHASLEPYHTGDIPLVEANFVEGDDESWRRSVSPDCQKRLWEATPTEVRDLLALRA
jgi:hypothetical protein